MTKRVSSRRRAKATAARSQRWWMRISKRYAVFCGVLPAIGLTPTISHRSFRDGVAQLARFEGRSSFRHGWRYRLSHRPRCERAHGRAQVRDTDWCRAEPRRNEAPIEDRIALQRAMNELLTTSVRRWRCVWAKAFRTRAADS